MKKVIALTIAVLVIGVFALVGHQVQKSKDVASTTTVQPTSTTDPGGGGRIGGV